MIVRLAYPRRQFLTNVSIVTIMFDDCLRPFQHCNCRILWLYEIRRSRGCETSAFGDLQTMVSGPPNFRSQGWQNRSCWKPFDFEVRVDCLQKHSETILDSGIRSFWGKGPMNLVSHVPCPTDRASVWKMSLSGILAESPGNLSIYPGPGPSKPTLGWCPRVI